MKRFITLALLAVWMVLPGWAQHEHQPRPSPTEAPAIYWVLVALAVVAIVGFMLWTLYGKMRPGRMTTLSYHALGALVIIMTLFTLVLYVIPAQQAQQLPATARAWDWKPGEILQDPAGSGLSGEPYRGYLVYLANGCTYCHTLYLRPEDLKTGWAEGARPNEVSQMGDFVRYPFTMLGTQRDGPDLTVIGRKIPDMQYQIDHLVDPRRFKPKSVMPSYRYLSERDLRDLAAYLVSLGNDPQKLRAGVAPTPKPTEDPKIAKGRELYRSLGCVGCHSLDGSPNVGPSFKGLWEREVEVVLPDGTTTRVIADGAYIRESITQASAKVVKGFPNVMPSFAERVTESDLDALVEYIKSLR
ncbi:MAG: cbb3-type cytochrome c oxidase subunit II [Candidatus Bipolaricaulota bacterium]|nr:cbb3-type cytochrome c oxidase subunit II [Candidatus Bipolaricaulota bacterium]MCS7275355.1 cbb3-type cytochrome c oxidase subunit II [Candidatus Bipolaricaulota bacterium]MDW8110146.1 cbb3-type cytochrome c oxidase subunit II [Candidatus Bipolaricaulota bacterium]MDW8329651.1 cbb3-type cytochrome c oxidase subunit II [Candidatus Bipolaricaulota bacterium]